MRSSRSTSSRSLSRWCTRSAVAGGASPLAMAASARRAASRASGHFCSFSSRSTSRKIESTCPVTLACRSCCCRAASASRATGPARSSQPRSQKARVRAESSRPRPTGPCCGGRTCGYGSPHSAGKPPPAHRPGTAECPCEAVGRLVASVAILLKRLHHDPIQLAAHQSPSCFASVPRLAANVGSLGRVQPVLGFVGSCSRITRSISSMPAWVNSFG